MGNCQTGLQHLDRHAALAAAYYGGMVIPRMADAPRASERVQHCTFDLWADDVPTCAVELRGDEVWVQPEFGRPDAAAYWRQRLEEGMAHNLGLVIAKAIQGQLAAGVSPIEIVRQAALFGARNRDGWGTGMTAIAIGKDAVSLGRDEEVR